MNEEKLDIREPVRDELYGSGQRGIRGNGKEGMDAGDTAKECLIRGEDIRIAGSG